MIPPITAQSFRGSKKLLHICKVKTTKNMEVQLNIMNVNKRRGERMIEKKTLALNIIFFERCTLHERIALNLFL